MATKLLYPRGIKSKHPFEHHYFNSEDIDIILMCMHAVHIGDPPRENQAYCAENDF